MEHPASLDIVVGQGTVLIQAILVTQEVLEIVAFQGILDLDFQDFLVTLDNLGIVLIQDKVVTLLIAVLVDIVVLMEQEQLVIVALVVTLEGQVIQDIVEYPALVVTQVV